MKPICLILLCSLLIGAASAGESYRVGVLAFRGLDEASSRWQPTVNYLTDQLADR
jgi:hypothetical protein